VSTLFAEVLPPDRQERPKGQKPKESRVIEFFTNCHRSTTRADLVVTSLVSIFIDIIF
jgi:hypothetical protein